MVPDPELIARVAPFADPGETVVGTFRAMRGPRPGSEALALVVNVPLLAFSPGGIVPTLLIGVALAAIVLVVIAALRQRVLSAVLDDGLLLLRCGQVPGRWIPHTLMQRGGWELLTVSVDQLGPRTTIAGVTYWIVATDLAEVRRLARWIAHED